MSVYAYVYNASIQLSETIHQFYNETLCVPDKSKDLTPFLLPLSSSELLKVQHCFFVYNMYSYAWCPARYCCSSYIRLVAYNIAGSFLLFTLKHIQVQIFASHFPSTIFILTFAKGNMYTIEINIIHITISCFRLIY